mgnify:CR=1 FL=1
MMGRKSQEKCIEWQARLTEACLPFKICRRAEAPCAPLFVLVLCLLCFLCEKIFHILFTNYPEKMLDNCDSALTINKNDIDINTIED